MHDKFLSKDWDKWMFDKHDHLLWVADIFDFAQRTKQRKQQTPSGHEQWRIPPLTAFARYVIVAYISE